MRKLSRRGDECGEEGKRCKEDKIDSKEDERAVMIRRQTRREDEKRREKYKVCGEKRGEDKRVVEKREERKKENRI